MIKEVLQQLEPLDAQIDALCSRAFFWPAALTARI